VGDEAGDVADPLLAEISERKISGGRTVAVGGFARAMHASFQCREHKLLWRPATRLLGSIYTVRLRVRDGNGAWSNVLRATAEASQ